VPACGRHVHMSGAAGGRRALIQFRSGMQTCTANHSIVASL
jgi:hypothetical protein